MRPNLEHAPSPESTDARSLSASKTFTVSLLPSLIQILGEDRKEEDKCKMNKFQKPIPIWGEKEL